MSWVKLKEEPMYEVNEFGTIRHIDEKFSKALVLHGKGNYITLLIHGDKRKRRYRVHRLVGKYFIPNPKKLPHINHIDGNKFNNHKSNLEWCTLEENNLHYAKRMGPMVELARKIFALKPAKRKVGLAKRTAKMFEVSVGTVQTIWRNGQYYGVKL